MIDDDSMPAIKESLGRIVECAMILSKVDAASNSNERLIDNIDFVKQTEKRLFELANLITKEKNSILQDFKAHTDQTGQDYPDFSFPECDWQLGVGRLTVEAFAKYFAPSGEDHSKIPLLRRRSSIPHYEVVSISCKPNKPSVLRSQKPDLAKQLRQNFTYEMQRIEVPFNIAYCVAELGKRHLLFGTKNQQKKQDLYKYSIESQSFTKIMPVGLIMDVVCFGQFILIAERNEDLKLFRGDLLIMVLNESFKPHYYQNQCANDSRVLHIHQNRRLYYITSLGAIIEYDAARMFTHKTIQIDKRGQIECLCIHGDYLICLSQAGDIISYSILDDEESSRANLERETFYFTTVATVRDKLVATAFSSSKSENLVFLLNPTTFEVVSSLVKRPHRYPYHTIRPLHTHNTFACVYRDTSSQISIFTTVGNVVSMIADIVLNDSMLYDIAVVDCRTVIACQWLTDSVVTKLTVNYD